MNLKNYNRRKLVQINTLPIAPVILSLLLLAAACGNSSSDSKEKTDSAKAKVDSSATGTTKSSPQQNPEDSAILTLSAIRETPDKLGLELLFNEREAIYYIKKETHAFARQDTLFRLALEKQQPLRIMFDTAMGFVRDAYPAKENELTLFRELHKVLISSRPAQDFPKGPMDSLKFSSSRYLKYWGSVFHLCNNVVPDLATANSIFLYCNQQSCNMAGPYPFPPCIPFQYVIDGCYARASKMDALIQAQYGYCCQKVFSFANQNNDVLAVKANKWGGCCVTWWYHVAPILRVQSTGGELIYVIDPGMFNGPVLLATWLQAQKDLSCSNRANVSTYSIQPGTAYGPANHSGTSFTTDPNYSSTNATLIAYANRKTCN